MSDVASMDMQNGADDPIEIYARRWKLALFACGALAFVVGGLLIGVAGDWRATTTVVIATYIGVPFFGLCSLYLIFRLVIRNPALVISDEGILDNASAMGAGLIRWEEIRDIRATSFGAQRMLVIVAKDDTAILARQDPVKRRIMRMNSGLAGYLVWIPGNILPMTVEGLRDRIKAFRKMHRTRQRPATAEHV